VLGVLLFSQVAALVVLVVLVGARGEGPPAAADLLPAVIGGAAGTVALGAFYRALSIGTMSIVAPISATGAAVPVIAGIGGGDRPGALQLAGIAAALTGVVLASREAHEDEARARDARRSVALALVAAAGFGTFLTLIGSAAEASVTWALLASRCTAVTLITVAVLAVRPPAPTRSDLPALALVGLLDLGANGLYAAATTEGLLSVVGVLGSLYPVTTVLLARAVLRERPRAVQEAGIVLALGGVALIAAG
jgi:drug/metabolite transporter (DMT)-like permease